MKSVEKVLKVQLFSNKHKHAVEHQNEGGKCTWMVLDQWEMVKSECWQNLQGLQLEIPVLGTWEGKKTSLYSHTYRGREGREGNGVWWGFLQIFKNFSAKNSACRKTKQTDNLSIPAMEEWPNCFHRRCCSPALPPHRTHLSPDGWFCPWSSQNTRDFISGST